MDFYRYIVKDSKVIPENPHNPIEYSETLGFGDTFSYVPDEYKAFETWKQSHTYFTNAKDGVYTKERFDIVWQYQTCLNGKWIDANTSIAIKHYKDFEDYKSFNMGLDRMVDARQFAKLKEDVEKPKESETINNKTMIQKAIKKPIPVEFIKLENTTMSIIATYRFINGEKSVELTSPMAHDYWDNYSDKCSKQGYMPLKTLESGEGTQNANIGDYILKGIDGECWPVKADIFERTYDVI